MENQAAPYKPEIAKNVPPAGLGKDFMDKIWKQSKEITRLAVAEEVA